MTMPHAILIRRSPVAFVRTVLLVELAAIAAFFAAQPLAYYEELYDQYVYTTYIPLPYDVVTVAVVALFEITLTIVVFLRWYAESYRIGGDRIVHERGIFRRARSSVILADITDADVHRGFLGSIFKYGTIAMQLAGKGRSPFSLRDIPSPERHAARIVNAAQRARARKTKENATLLTFAKVIERKEDASVEFKSSLRWDHKTGRINRELERAALKTVAAFLNSEGGTLVIGIGDDGRAMGIHDDCATLQRKDPDGFENHFSQAFRSAIGAEHRRHCALEFHDHDGATTCLVRVASSHCPAYLTWDGKEEFFIRTGNTTTALTLREAQAYIASQWGSGE